MMSFKLEIKQTTPTLHRVTVKDLDDSLIQSEELTLAEIEDLETEFLDASMELAKYRRAKQKEEHQ